MLGNIPVEKAIAAVINFQDRYDLSVRLEWDSSKSVWKITANKLADLTKRENRFGHFFYRPVASGAKPVGREYPYALVSNGSGYSGNSQNVQFVSDITPTSPAIATANIDGGTVVNYTVTNPGQGYTSRPFAYVDGKCTAIATAQAMLNDDGQVVRLVHGPVPLCGTPPR